jgi:hypothetical protein
VRWCTDIRWSAGCRNPVWGGHHVILRTIANQSEENNAMTNPHPTDVEKLLADRLAAAGPGFAARAVVDVHSLRR